MGCGTGLAKAILIVFNIIFWLSGACILGIGIWLRVDKNILDILKIASVSSSGSQLDNAAYIFIGFGAFVFIVGFLGCCGAWHMNKCLLGLYILFLVVVMAGELAAGILAVVLQGKVESELKEAWLKELTMDKFIEDNTTTPIKYSPLGLSINAMQWKFDCCGVDSYEDYYMQNVTQWPKIINGMSRNYPFSCCNVTNLADPRQLAADKVLNITECYNKNAEYFHGQGCYNNILDDIKSHSLILIGVGCGIAGLEVIVIICAICLCRIVDKDE